jgi:hypothetical protein
VGEQFAFNPAPGATDSQGFRSEAAFLPRDFIHHYQETKACEVTFLFLETTYKDLTLLISVCGFLSTSIILQDRASL